MTARRLECAWCGRPARRTTLGQPMCSRHEWSWRSTGDPHGRLPSAVRYPLAPLVRMLGDTDAGVPSVEQLAALFDVHDTQVSRWARVGLSVETADRAACAAGFHPAEVWADWAADIDPARPLDPVGVGS